MIPHKLSAPLRNLLEGFFVKDPLKRLGGGPDDAKQIKMHPWFSGLDWDKILRKELPVPVMPNLKSETDFSNFDPVKN